VRKGYGDRKEVTVKPVLSYLATGRRKSRTGALARDGEGLAFTVIGAARRAKRD